MKFTAFLLSLLSCLALALSARAGEELLQIISPADAKVIRVEVQAGTLVYSGDTIATLKKNDGATIVLRAGLAGKIVNLGISPYQIIEKDRVIGSLQPSAIVVDTPEAGGDHALPSLSQLAINLFKTTGLYGVIEAQRD